MNTNRIFLFTLTIVLALFALISAVYFYNFRNFDTLGNQEAFGQFGDYIGGILNPILSTATLLVVIWSSHSQNIESNTTIRLLFEANQLQERSLSHQQLETRRDRTQELADRTIHECKQLLKRKVFALNKATDMNYLTEINISLSDLTEDPQVENSPQISHLINSIQIISQEKTLQGLHLAKIRSALQTATYATCAFLEITDSQPLQIAYKGQLRETITLLEALKVINEQTANEYKTAIEGAIANSEKTFGTKNPISK